MQTISNDSIFDKESYNKKTINSKEDSGLYNISSCSKQSQSKEVYNCETSSDKILNTQQSLINQRDQSMKIAAGSRNHTKFPRLMSVKSMYGREQIVNDTCLQQQDSENDDKLDFKTFCINLEKKLKY